MTAERYDRSPFRGEIDREFGSPEFVAALGRLREIVADPRSEILLRGRNTVVAAEIPASATAPIPCVVKSYRTAGLQRLKTLLLPSKAARAWRGARALAAAGIETPRPLAYLERRAGGLVVESYFVSERVPGLPEIRALFCDPGADGLRPPLAALAAHVAALHRAGLLHRDLSDGNILVRREGGTFSFVFLDTNRVRSGRRLGGFRRARNLVRLGIPPADRMFFLERYAEARGEKFRRVFVLYYKSAKITFAAWLRAKKALRLKKAARALRIQ
jgi:hypothetical protein